MPVQAPDGPASAAPRPAAGLNPLAWRLPAIETWPRVVAFVQTLPGKLVLFAVFAGLMKLAARGMWFETGGWWLIITVAAAAVSVAGRYRHLVLLLCTGLILVRAPNWFEFRGVHTAIRQEHLLVAINPEHLRAGVLLLCALLAAGSIHLARRFRDHPLGRRPALAQHVLYFCLIGLVASHTLHGLPQIFAWCVIAAFSGYFYYLAYALMDQRPRNPAPLTLELATFNPLYWSTGTPMGGSAANWRSVEATSARELAVTQLKAMKLLVWALVLKGALWLLRWTIYGKLGVPTLRVAFDRFVHGGDVPAPLGLAAIVANFPEQLLIIALWGHVIIATGRLAGFRLLRNTCRPLSARTVADFWNRYFYYFKEVLVHVYFYPTYLRCFKRHPRLRIAFATFMAAGVGNFLFHFIWENHTIAQFGLIGALVHFQTYGFYCALLVAGIVWSQLRTHAPGPGAGGGLRGRVLQPLRVAAFFCFLTFFDIPQVHVPLAQHLAFLFQVFSVNRWMQAIG